MIVLIEIVDNVPKLFRVSKGTKIRNRYNQVTDLTQDTNGKVTNSQLHRYDMNTQTLRTDTKDGQFDY